MKEFKNVNIGDKGNDQFGYTPVIVKAKGTWDEIKHLNIGTQASLDDLDEDELDEFNLNECVACVLIDDYESFDHSKGDTIVWLYGCDGIMIE